MIFYFFTIKANYFFQNNWHIDWSNFSKKNRQFFELAEHSLRNLMTNGCLNIYKICNLTWAGRLAIGY